MPPSIYDNKDCYVQALEIPSSVKTIKSWAFYYFTHLEKITFHEGLKTIEANAFRRTIGYDAGNYELHFPKSLESIGNYAFDQCGISKVYLNSTVSCGTGAFSDNTILHFYDDDTEVVFKDYKGL